MRTALTDLPVVVWLIHGVHGNEISSSDAALQEAYHLLAARGNADVDLTLRDAIVIIDPMQNPDGRQRFVTSNLLGRAVEPDPESAVGGTRRAVAGRPVESLPVRHEPRLFRDDAARNAGARAGDARVVSAGRRRSARDGRELDAITSRRPPIPSIRSSPRRSGSGSTRSAAPTRRSSTSAGSAYFVREVYDSFYPGYGDSWPMFHGAVGMTYEQASARGLAFRREDGTMLTYKQAVTQHFTAARDDGGDRRAATASGCCATSSSIAAARSRSGRRGRAST